MKYHALFVFFLKKQQNLKLSSAANYRWRFKGLKIDLELIQSSLSLVTSLIQIVNINYIFS